METTAHVPGGGCGGLYSTSPSLLPLPPPTPNQLVDSFSEMHFSYGYSNEKPSYDTDAPPGDWTPGPLSIQPVSQSLPVSLTPLPFPSYPPPLHPFCYAVRTNLGSGFHAQGVLGLGAEVTASLF